MKLEERCLGVELTPEAKAQVRSTFEGVFDRIEGQVDHAQVRLLPAPAGVACRASLHPVTGATLVATETRATMLEAVLASANSLARALQRRQVLHGWRSRRHEAAGMHRARAVWP